MKMHVVLALLLVGAAGEVIIGTGFAIRKYHSRRSFKQIRIPCFVVLENTKCLHEASLSNDCLDLIFPFT